MKSLRKIKKTKKSKSKLYNNEYRAAFLFILILAIVFLHYFLLFDFVNDFEAEQLLLRVNYRSSPEIIESSLAVINCNKNRFVKNLCANPQKFYSNSKNIVVLKEFANTDLQYRYLAEQLKAKTIENTSKNITQKYNSGGAAAAVAGG